MTELRQEAYIISAAATGPENPLPWFRRPPKRRHIQFAPSVTAADRRYMGWETATRVLPYRMQDGYTRERAPHAFHAVVLENEHLKATFLPEVGGRLVSLLHKASGRELLARNPVFQPANLALRDAWFSGGVEWNAGLLGHHYFTCSPVFAARIRGSQGEPALRIYEWERSKRFSWQVDFHLPPGSEFLYAHVRLVNPHDRRIPMYWWTNIAVRETPDTRVLCPANSVLRPTAKEVSADSLPLEGHPDVSYTTRLQDAQEFFFRIEDTQRRWIAALDASGQGLVQTSTARLRGRKLFLWGSGRGGQRWQEFLAEPGWAYIEIQAGLARTQMESLPMPARAHWSWTEAFGLLQARPEDAHAADWDHAWRTADEVLEKKLPAAEVRKTHKRLLPLADEIPEEMLQRGSGWGALERRRIARQGGEDRVPAALVFGEDTLGPEQEPWLALLGKGALPEGDPQQEPGAYMTQPEWTEMLERCEQAGHGNWLSALHLGVARAEATDYRGAEEAWRTSLERKHNAWALRNLAVLQARRADRAKGSQAGGEWDAAGPKARQAAAGMLREAWETGPEILPLALEYAEALWRVKDFAGIREFVAGAPREIAMHERLQILEARAALELGHYAEVEKLFERDFTNVREGEVVLTDVWFEMHARRLAQQEGVPVTNEIRERARKEFPPPAHIDFRMTGAGQ